VPTQFDEVEGFVLAGGRSSRMGQDKALLEIGGMPMILHVVRLLEAVVGRVSVVAPPERYANLGLRVLPEDDVSIVGPRVGPVRGIVTGLRRTDAAGNLFVSCDMPHLTREWLEYLVSRALSSSADTVLAEGSGLCVMFRRESEERIERALVEGAYKYWKAMKYLSYEVIRKKEFRQFDPEGLLFADIDVPEEYEQARARLDRDPQRPAGP
jgi:molybdopterin-guanine dinucleotide biosynthesis protein A